MLAKPETTLGWEILENHKDFTWIMANNRVEDLFFNRISEAIFTICADKMRLDIQASLKAIAMVPSGSGLTFKSSKVEMSFDPADEGAWSVEVIQKYLEQWLLMNTLFMLLLGGLICF